MESEMINRYTTEYDLSVRSAERTHALLLLSDFDQKGMIAPPRFKELILDLMQITNFQKLFL